MSARATLLLVALAVLAMLAPGIGDAQPDGVPAPSEGDLVFHESRSAQSEAIRLATGSRYTHMGIVFHRGGRPFVLEAGRTVRFTPLDRWTARGVGGRVVVKRLRDAARVLDAPTLARMKDVGEAFVGKPYDARFEWSDERIYCSELVYKIYERGAAVRIGALRPARDFDLSSPQVRELITRRFRGAAEFDPDEPVLSPQAMFEDESLVTVGAE